MNELHILNVGRADCIAMLLDAGGSTLYSWQGGFSYLF